MLDTNPARGVAYLKRLVLLTLAAAVCTASGLKAQCTCYPPHSVTDGWKAVYVAHQGWYYLQPGQELRVYSNVYTWDGGQYVAWFVQLTTPAPSMVPTDLPVIRGAPAVPDGAAPPLGAVAPAAGPEQWVRVPGADGAESGAPRFAKLDSVSMRALDGFIRPGTLARLEADQQLLGTTLLQWAREQRVSARSFEALRASARRMERTLSGVVSQELPRSGDKARRAEAVRTITRLVENLEFLLPLLADSRRAAQA